MREKKLLVDDIPTDKNFDIIFNNAQDVNHRIMRTVPLPDNLKEGELILVYNGQTARLYTKISGLVLQVTLT